MLGNVFGRRISRLFHLLVAVLIVAGGVAGGWASARATQEAPATPRTATPEELADPDGAFVEIDGAWRVAQRMGRPSCSSTACSARR
jgi:hypothetical protein